MAVDADEGTNSRVVYKLNSSWIQFGAGPTCPGSPFHITAKPIDINCFSIDSITGMISSKCTFDREQYASISLKVVAQDQGFPPLSSTAEVTLQIEDENDNAPRFSRSSYEFSIAENLPNSGTFLGKAEAYDCDEGTNGNIKYSIQSVKGFGKRETYMEATKSWKEVQSDQFFSVRGQGDIYAVNVLDREQYEVFEFYIVASDDGAFPKSSSAIVRVQIIDR